MLFNFASANQYGWMSLSSTWSPSWEHECLRRRVPTCGADAGKFVVSITGRSRKLGALNVGGAAGSDSAIIPGREAFSIFRSVVESRRNNWMRAWSSRTDNIVLV